MVVNNTCYWGEKISIERDQDDWEAGCHFNEYDEDRPQ